MNVWQQRELERIRIALERIADKVAPEDEVVTYGDDPKPQRLVEHDEAYWLKHAQALNEGAVSLETNPLLLGKIVEGSRREPE